jgi:hypothetical protein
MEDEIFKERAASEEAFAARRRKSDRREGLSGPSEDQLREAEVRTTP